MKSPYPFDVLIYLLTAIGLSPGGSSTVHIYTNSTWNNTNNNRTTQITTNLEERGLCPAFASFTLAFSLQLRKKHRKTSVRVRKTSVRVRKTSVIVQYTYYQKTHTHTPHTHTLQNNIKPTQYKLKQTVQDIPKWNSHSIIKYPQYKVTLMYIAPLSTRTSP
jgi:hypothetical protein